MSDLNIAYLNRRGEHYWFVYDDQHIDDLLQKLLWLTRRKTLSFDRHDFYQVVSHIATLEEAKSQDTL